MHHVKARIQWIPYSQGGRKTIPSGPQYSTVARFEDDATSWPEQAWSIVAEFDVSANPATEMIVKLRFLVPDAPLELLQAGSRFELFEGNRIVAQGVVLD